ncbi:HD domain-containing protein [Sporolactobacillus sp. THM7-7]|nr:HD domain-containing protein [Sporolactobacillus sp. THM7-7]
MKIEEARRAIKELLPEKRYTHSLGVSETAGRLAEKYGAEPAKARLAGMLHDIVKYFSDERLEAMIRRRSDISDNYLNYSSKLWHAPCGAAYVQETYGIDDPEVLCAMTYHTTGKRNMTELDKIIFLADYIEPGRDFPGVEEVREAASRSLNEAVFLELQKTIVHLLDKRQKVYPDTMEAYNEMVGSF